MTVIEEAITACIIHNCYASCGVFSTRNTVGDYTTIVHKSSRIRIEYAPYYDYIEIFGLCPKEFEEFRSKYNKLVEQRNSLIEEASVPNSKGFKILKLTQEEAKKLGFGVDEGCICMHCNDIISGYIYYIAALNDTMCVDCYNKWIRTATRYEEDSKYEEAIFNRVIKRLITE